MTGERNTFSCRHPPPRVCLPHRATDRRAASTKQLANICCVGCRPPTAPWLISPRPQATPLRPSLNVPQTALAFSCLSHTSSTFCWVLQTLKGHGRVLGRSGGDGDIGMILEGFLYSSYKRIVFGQDALNIRGTYTLLIPPFWAFQNPLESLIVLTAMQYFFKFVTADLAHRRELRGGHTCADTALYHIAEDCQG